VITEAEGQAPGIAILRQLDHGSNVPELHAVLWNKHLELFATVLTGTAKCAAVFGISESRMRRINLTPSKWNTVHPEFRSGMRQSANVPNCRL
jgi:hypothetical protein